VETHNGDGTKWVYAYDQLGQVTSGKKFWPDSSPAAGQQFEYDFDDIGNRQTTKAGGDGNGNNLRTASYSVNSLNQYSDRTVPGAVDVIGTADATATVTVNTLATERKGPYFRREVTVNNTAGPVDVELTTLAVKTGPPDLQASKTGRRLLPGTPQNFDHDLDGNLESDGLWVYTWDGENRLVRLVSAAGVEPARRLDFTYDWAGRRIRKRLWENTAGSGTPAVDQRFVYDGWNVVAVVNGSGTLAQAFTWGNDLSGTMQGAGGVGGLLMVHQATTHFVAYDGNGNVAGLVHAANGMESGRYEYGPFGEVLRVSGAAAEANAIRFSTKWEDVEIELGLCVTLSG
jgi:hypothetical protein